MEFPKKGDIIIADAEPHAGHEMGGRNPKKGNIRRHYVVMSTSAYNEATHMFIGMPITTANYSNNPRYMPILIMVVTALGLKDTLFYGNYRILTIMLAMELLLIIYPRK